MAIKKYELPDSITVLGTVYKILYQTEAENQTLAECDGLCDCYKKIIFIERQMFENDERILRGFEVMRHEIIHAFFFESGLAMNCEWAQNEELTDWLAIQFPKIADCFKNLEN